MDTTSGTKEISNAWELYPNCSPQFATGVHTYLNGKPIPQRPCDDEHIQGWMCAERDLGSNYKLKR